MPDGMHGPGPDPSREEAIEQHLPLVERIARRLASRGEPLDDLVQAGSIGLIKAVDRFDPDRGPTLATFAAPVIEGEIRHHLRRRRRDARREAPGSLEGVEHGADAGDQTDARLLVAEGWRSLSEPDRRLLELRYFDDLTQAEIARRLGISQAQVSRRLRATLGRLESELSGVARGEDRAYSQEAMTSPARESEPERRAHSGRLLVRMPQSLHAELARVAEREGVSLNSFVTGALARAVGWRETAEPAAADDNERSRPDRGAATARDRTWLSVALAANFAIVTIAAILAIVLLVLAWQSG